MSDLIPWLLGIQLATTLPLVGLIWTIQLVHYPLFSQVGESHFVRYQHAHMGAIGPLVGPLMLLEMLTVIGLVIVEPNALSALGLVLVLVIWGSTVLFQIPCHRRLTVAFEDESHQRLVRSNWIRTIAWSIRGVLAILMCPGFSFTS